MNDPARPRAVGLRRAALGAAVLALVVGAAAWWAGRPGPGAVAPDIDAVVAAPAPTPAATPQAERPVVGGVYAGRVVDKADQPVAGATVLLVGEPQKRVVPIASPVVAPDPNQPPPTIEIVEIGRYETVGETTSDAAGRFRLAAGSYVTAAVVGYERAHAPGLLTGTPEVPLVPGNDLVLRLPDPGWLRGTVVDKETKAPVSNAEITIYMQSVSNQATPGALPATPANSWGKLADFVGRELGPRVWGVTPVAGDTGFHVWTKPDGTFEFGPLTNEAQVEVVVSHPEYMWTEQDPTVHFEADNPREGQPGYRPGAPPIDRVRRLVIPPGETVERRYELVKGREVRGRVVDEKDQPIEGVEISLEHVAQYAQHHFYRSHARPGRTDSDGYFRIAGLSFPPYSLHFEHLSFGTDDKAGVKETPPETAKADVPVYKIAASGWIVGTVTGGPADRRLYQATLRLQPDGVTDTPQRYAVNVRDGTFEVPKVRSGKYLAWLEAGGFVSDPVAVSVESKETRLAIALSSGGKAEIAILDRTGASIDPATVDLEMLGDDGTVRSVGRTTSREGVARAETLRSGRYRARIHSPGFLDETTAPFLVASERTTQVEPVTLRKPGFVRIQSIRGADGRGISVDARVEVAEGDEPLAPRLRLNAGLVQVRPGKVRVRVTTSDGRAFDQTYDVEEDRTVPVDVVVQ